MRRVLPDGGRQTRPVAPHLVRSSHREIDSFAPDVPHRASYYGIFEDNDPAKRLMVVANFDNDVPEYWEWSGRGLFPFDASNDAYKLGVNYLIYGLTH